MALNKEEQELLRRLTAKLSRERGPLERLDAYYDGTHRLEQLGLAVPPELERFVTIVNWPRVAADAVEHRCDIEGFRLRGADSADDGLWDIWQANDADETSQMGNLESIKLGRSYGCVGGREPDAATTDSPSGEVPVITFETPFEMTHEQDARTRRVTDALRRTDSTAGTARQAQKWATLYRGNETIWCERQGRGWVDVERDRHGIGRPLVEPLINRPSLRKPYGVSEMEDVISLTDAASRALTNAQVATEVMAIPARWAAGMSKGDFVDPKTGDPLTTWETYFGAVWATTNKDAKFGQFSAADLKNFETIVWVYANLVAGESGLPARYFGQTTVNPPSEGSIVSDETRLIMNAYRHHRWLGGSYERLMRLVRRIIDKRWNPELQRLETLWRNPETPTRAQTADAVVKLHGAKDQDGISLLPREAAWEELGYSATRRKQLAEMVRAERLDRAANDPVVRAANAFRETPDAPGDPAPSPEPDPTPAPDPAPEPVPAPVVRPGRRGRSRRPVAAT